MRDLSRVKSFVHLTFSLAMCSAQFNFEFHCSSKNFATGHMGICRFLIMISVLYARAAILYNCIAFVFLAKKLKQFRSAHFSIVLTVFCNFLSNSISYDYAPHMLSTHRQQTLMQRCLLLSPPPTRLSLSQIM